MRKDLQVLETLQSNTLENPTEPGFYTTIFKDGSIIHYNEWINIDTPYHPGGKWYWNEDLRGGVIHWFKPQEEYIQHKWYKLPDWELRDLIKESLRFEYVNHERLNEIAQKYLDTYYKGYEIFYG